MREVNEDGEYEYVRSSRRQRSYYRRVPWCRANPTLPQRKVRHALAKLAHEKATGTTGKVLVGEKAIPLSAQVIQQGLGGHKFAPEKVPRVPEVLVKLKVFCDEIAKSVESARFINRDVIPRMLAEQRKKELPRLLKWQREEEKKKAEIISKGKRVA